MQFLSIENLIALGVSFIAPHSMRVVMDSLKVIQDGMDWYQSLRSGTVFGSSYPSSLIKAPIWMFTRAMDLINIFLGIASYLVYLQGGFIQQILPFSLYFVMLLVMSYWPRMFFRDKKIGQSLCVLGVGLFLGIISTFFFSLSSLGAAILSSPIILWTIYMVFITWNLWRSNFRNVIVSQPNTTTGLIRSDKESLKQPKESGKAREVREPAEIDERKPKTE